MWVRAGLLHPLYLVGPSVVVVLLAATSKSKGGTGVAWAFAMIPLGALLSFALGLIATIYALNVSCDPTGSECPV